MVLVPSIRPVISYDYPIGHALKFEVVRHRRNQRRKNRITNGFRYPWGVSIGLKVHGKRVFSGVHVVD